MRKIRVKTNVSSKIGEEVDGEEFFYIPEMENVARSYDRVLTVLEEHQEYYKVQEDDQEFLWFKCWVDSI